MSLIQELIRKPDKLPISSKYTLINGVIYTATGTLIAVWPNATQTLLRDRDFVGDEQSLLRVVGLTVIVIGWFYLFGGSSGAQQIVAASVVNRLTFVPIVLLILAAFGVFPHLLVTFAVFDAALAIGAWILLGRKKTSP